MCPCEDKRIILYHAMIRLLQWLLNEFQYFFAFYVLRESEGKFFTEQCICFLFVVLYFAIKTYLRCTSDFFGAVCWPDFFHLYSMLFLFLLPRKHLIGSANPKLKSATRKAWDNPPRYYNSHAVRSRQGWGPLQDFDVSRQDIISSHFSSCLFILLYMTP